MCSTSYNDLNWDMCPRASTMGRERLFVWLTIRESDPCRRGKQLLVEGGEMPEGQAEDWGQAGRKKEVTTWYPAYAYLETDACLYTCLEHSFVRGPGHVPIPRGPWTAFDTQLHSAQCTPRTLVTHGSWYLIRHD